MNYAAINKAILDNIDVPEFITKNNDFYTYLLNNRVAYYYSKKLSIRPNETERNIVKRGERFNAAALKSITDIDEVAEESDIRYALFKTVRYIDQPIDGDIDLLVSPNDMNSLLEGLRKKDYKCLMDEPGKANCIKKGSAEIEPHSQISWDKRVGRTTNGIIMNATDYTLGGVKFKNASPTDEITAMDLELRLSPEYVDLYTILRLRELEKTVHNGDMTLLQSFVHDTVLVNKIDKRLPAFLKNSHLLRSSDEVSSLEKTKLLVRNTYWKNRYRFFCKLPFTHDWDV